jgi:hypothetical protein
VSEYQNISRFYKVVRGGRGRGRLSAWYLEPLSSYSCSCIHEFPQLQRSRYCGDGVNITCREGCKQGKPRKQLQK